MNKTLVRESGEKITDDIDSLSAMLSCGYATARKIGEQAGGRICIGKRVLYSVDRVRKYIGDISELVNALFDYYMETKELAVDDDIPPVPTWQDRA